MRKRIRMKWCIWLFVCLLVLGTAFSAFAEERENPAAAARRGVVRIYARCEDGCTWKGSGFGVGKAGEETDIFVTNWHVAVQPCDHGTIVNSVWILLDNHAINYMEVDYSRMIRCQMVDTTTSIEGIPDFAVLRAERKVPGRIALPLLPRDQCSESERVFAIGFPGTGDIANGGGYIAAEVSEVTSTEGTISRMLDNYKGNPYEVIQHTAHINHGNSGGPLITESGAVIGLNTYGYGDATLSADLQWNPSEYSVAVSIDYVIKSLNKLDFPYEIYSGSEPVKEKASSGLGILIMFPVMAIAVMVAIAAIVLMKKKGVKPQPAIASQGASQIQPQYQQSQPQYQQPQSSSAPRQAVPIGGHGQQPGGTVSQLKLKGTKGCFDGRIFAFSKDRYQFGTSESCQLKYPSGTPGIGLVHCELQIRNGSFYLVDMGSQFGTYVNGKKITPRQSYPLKEGDAICLASAQEAFQVINN